MKTICSACGMATLKNKGKHPDGIIYSCTKCGSSKLELSLEASQTLGEDYGEAYRSGLEVKKATVLIRLFRKLVSDHTIAPGNLIDLGCGDGSFMKLAAKENWTISGIDTDAISIEALVAEGIDARLGELGGSDMPPYKNADVITLWDLIEHIRDLDNAMAWLSDVIRPGGYIMIVTPNADSVLDYLAWFERAVTFTRSQRLFNLCLNRYHLHRFTKQGLCTLFQRYGFVIEAVDTVQLLSLKPEKYLSGFAPGISGWTGILGLDRWLSKVGYSVLKYSGIKNKITLVARRTSTAKASTPTAMRNHQ